MAQREKVRDIIEEIQEEDEPCGRCTQCVLDSIQNNDYQPTKENIMAIHAILKKYADAIDTFQHIQEESNEALTEICEKLTGDN
jgi:hypothetical protein